MAQWCVNLNGRPDDEAVGKVFDLVIRDSTTIPQLTS